jgi:hypothetical protein
MRFGVEPDSIMNKMERELESVTSFSETNIEQFCTCIGRISELLEDIEELEKKISQIKRHMPDPMGGVYLLLIFALPVLVIGGIVTKSLGFVGFFGLFMVVPALYAILSDYSKSKSARRELEWKQLRLERLQKELRSDSIKNCDRIIKETWLEEGVEQKFLAFLKPELQSAISALKDGNLEEARLNFLGALNRLPEFDNKLARVQRSKYRFRDRYSVSTGRIDELNQTLQFFCSKEGAVKELLLFSADVCESLYLGDSEEAMVLVQRAKQLRNRHGDFVIGDLTFFKHLFEFQYVTLRKLIDSGEIRPVPVRGPSRDETEQPSQVSTNFPSSGENVGEVNNTVEKELYRGKVNFSMGMLSEERTGSLVVTNERIILSGKYKIVGARGNLFALGAKAALRAAGVGDVDEVIPLRNVQSIQLKKTLTGAQYLVVKAGGKKYTIRSKDVQHIYNLLKTHTKA